jgi:hypothetical protein
MFAQGAPITAADAAAVLIRCVENNDVDRVRRRHPGLAQCGSHMR